MTQTVLILGSNGRFGHHAALAFEAAGWTVRRFDRNTDDLNKASLGVDVIVNAWNPLYTQWASQVPNQTAQICDVAKRNHATVIVPGNVYVFGSQTPAPWSEKSTYAAENPLGQIRIKMEETYRNAGVKTIVLRAGDYLDTRKSGNWFDQIMTKKLNKGVFTYPGNPDIPHAWAFLPDVCRAAVQLAEKRTELPEFCDVPFPGYTLTGTEIAGLVDQSVEGSVRLKQMSWWPIQAMSAVWPMGRKLVEMRFLWNTPHWLDESQFNALLPGFEHTPPQQALALAVQGAGGTLTSTQTNRWRLAETATS